MSKSTGTVDIAFPPRPPRSYQAKVWEALSSGIKRACLVWHRRSGKSLTLFQYQIGCALQMPGYYPYFFPKYKQGRKILWHGQDRQGQRFIDFIPSQLILKKVEDEMMIRLRCQGGGESTWQIVGTDNFASIVGTNPIGPVFDEYTLQNPAAWDYTRPILTENGGWAAFSFTPRGRGHGYRMYHEWSLDKDQPWYRDYRTIRDTRRDAPGEDGTPIVTDAQVQSEVRQGMHPARAQQEYYCSWAGALQGAIYGWLMNAVYDEGRVGRLGYDRALPVYTAWDVGRHDHTAIWIFQRDGDQYRFLRYLEDRGHGLHHYVQRLREYDYDYAEHWFPWDMGVTEYTAQEARIEVAKSLLGDRCFIAPKLPIEDGIDATRRIFHLLHFDQENCARGLDVLQAYKYEALDDEDLDNPRFKAAPEHDWASHGADAIRVISTGFHAEHRMMGAEKGAVQVYSLTDFDPITGIPAVDPRTRPRLVQPYTEILVVQRENPAEVARR